MTTPTMQAAVQHGYGDPMAAMRLGRVPRPEPGPGEVLVEVRATSVNTPDWLAVTGTPWVVVRPTAPRRPRTPVRGTDVAGVVVRVGSGVTDLGVGDEVLGSTWSGSLWGAGAFGEFAVAPREQLVAKPDALTWAEAGAAAMSGVTALVGIHQVARVGPGTTVLVNGASGGVGTFMVQMAARLGAEVTGVCSGRNAALVRSLGATHVVDHTEGPITEVDARYDVVVDNVLNHPGPALARLLAPGGLLVPNSVGVGGDVLRGLPRIGWSIVLGRLGRLPTATIDCEFTQANLTRLADMLASREVEVVVDGTYPLAEAPRAVAHMAGHHARGNVVVEVPGGGPAPRGTRTFDTAGGHRHEDGGQGHERGQETG